jgi:AcrR family transcriptional regulator
MDRTRSATREPRRRTGGRSARVVNAVLEATLDVLARAGFGALSFDAVAAQAGVSRTTIYRRWATRHDLVRAALLRLAEVQPVPAEASTLREDLVEFIRARLIGNRRERERALALLRANAADLADPELVALGRLVQENIQRPIVGAVERAIARGELPAGTDPGLVIEPIFATLHFHLFLFAREPELAYAEQLVDLVLTGARAGAAVRRLAGR